MANPITIWRYEDAPEEYKQHFESSDCDWIAHVPKDYLKQHHYVPIWLDSPVFGCCEVDEFTLDNGDILRASYHS
jgi:hypothetical protein